MRHGTYLLAHWLIVEQEQQGESRAAYGAQQFSSPSGEKPPQFAAVHTLPNLLIKLTPH